MNTSDHKLCSWPYPVQPSGWMAYDDDKDYCGPESEWYSKYLSRYIIGVDCNKVYWAHDNRYSLARNEKDRKFADKQMMKDQKTAIYRAYGWWHPLRFAALLIAYRRYQAVSWFGSKHARQK